MAYRDIAPFPKQMTIVLGLVVVGLMAFGLALSYYKNVLFDRQLLTMEQNNRKLKSEIATGYRHLDYLASDQYKDKYAKENMGLLRAGEKVLIIARTPEPVTYAKSSDPTIEEKEAMLEENLRNIRVIDHWRLYLFHRDQIEELRKQLL